MRFSIVIPAHNGELYLRLAIESALSQVRKADEIIIVDDASTDRTAEIAQSEEWGNKIHYVYNNEPSGFADAFNRIFQLAKGDYVVLLSCDDLLDENHLYHVEKALKKYPSAQHCFCGYYYIDEKGSQTGVSPEPYSLEPALLTGKEYSHKYLQGVFNNRHIHRCLGFATERKLFQKCSFRKEAGLIADDDFFLRIGEFTDVVGISQPLVYVRHHSTQISAGFDSLTKRLAEDYLFQTQYYITHATHLEASDIKLLHKLAVRFINLLLYEGLKNCRAEWVNYAMTLKNDFEKLVPKFMDQALPFWGKILWRITLNDMPSYIISKLYVRFIANVVKFKNTALLK